MDFQTENAVIAVWEAPTPCEAECPIDGDFLLPDYCPDIAAILKCTVKPAVLSRQWSGDKLLVEGQSLVRVLYLDEERKCVRSFEGIHPFHGTIDAVGTSPAELPYVSVRVNYVNCRAVSPRRIGVHGALTVKMECDPVKPAEVISDISGQNLYTRQEDVFCTVPVGAAEKNFSIGEVVDLGGGKPAAEMLIRTDCTPLITECKQLSGKAIVKGRILLKTLYAVNTTDGTTEVTNHEFPFSQIIEMDGMEDTTQCLSHIDLQSLDVHITADQNGNGTLLSVNIKLCIRLNGWRTDKIGVVTDAYSGIYPCESESGRFVSQELCFARRENTVLKEVLELPSDSVTEIVDIWCETVPVTTRMEGEMCYADGHLPISMLARDREGCLSYYEHVSDFTLQFDDRCDCMTADVTLVGVEYAIVGGKIEIRLEFSVDRCGYNRRSLQALTYFDLLGEPYPSSDAALRICRAKKGDSVWEIAKTCHTAVEAVLEENELPGDEVPEDMMLLVPLC